MMPAYDILPELFLRTPLLTYAGFKDRAYDALLASGQFRLALFLASPGFYRVLEAKQFRAEALVEKEKLTLWKYHNRMSFRPTPFGLFSAFSVCRWGNAGNLVLAGSGDTRLHVLPDQQLVPVTEIKQGVDALAMSYRLNPCLYRLSKEFRFIRTSLQPGQTKLSFSLESLDADAFTRRLFSLL